MFTENKITAFWCLGFRCRRAGHVEAMTYGTVTETPKKGDFLASTILSRLPLRGDISHRTIIIPLFAFSEKPFPFYLELM